MAHYTLYSARGTCALATHIALLEAGADFALHLLDFKLTEQRSAAYLALNPKGRVPALLTPQGVLTETPALLMYVAQTHPHAGLAPLDDPFRLARLQELNSYLASTVHVAHAHKHRGARWSDDPAAHDSMRAKVAQNMTDCAVLLEDWLAPGPWVLGDRYSVADAYLYVVTGWMDSDGVDMQRFARLRGHQARVAARPATQQALAQLG